MITSPHPAGLAPEVPPLRGGDSNPRPVQPVHPPPQDSDRSGPREPRRFPGPPVSSLEPGSSFEADGADGSTRRRDRPASVPALSEDKTSPFVERAAIAFLAHVLGQDRGGQEGGRPVAQRAPRPADGTDAYRRAGGEPLIFSDTPAYFRLLA